MTYTLPHPLDRPGQQAAYNWIMSNPKKWLIICAPTGSGKSAWAAEASKSHKVLTLVETKSLQSANYRDTYKFDILYGKSNYRCEDEKGKRLFWTAFDCGNPDCNCEYNQRVTECLDSYRVSLNYAKYLMSPAFTDGHSPDILFLDEAHNLPEICTEWMGLTIRWDNEFIRQPAPSSTMQLNYAEAIHYIGIVRQALLSNKPHRENDLEKWRKWKRLSQRVELTFGLIDGREPRDWYFLADPDKLLIKPFTAKYHFQQLFDKASKIVLMSATIDPSITKRLGIGDNEFDFYEVPNPWPVPSRIIYDLDCPRMNFSASKGDRDYQARMIALVCKSDKSGIIHVSSKRQAYNLADKLAEMGIETWFPTDGIGTDKQLQEWYEYRRPGLYCISWCFHEGVDLGGDDINIIAKVPYGDISDHYEKAKADYDKGWYFKQAAYRIMQACGRNRRGKVEHYLPGARQVFLADGSWKTKSMRGLLSKDFLMSVRSYNGKP
jgi:Rad3-related DNA helicase